jgi:two-component system LytT family response regulator
MKSSCIICDEPGTLTVLQSFFLKISSLDLKGQFNNLPDALIFLKMQRVDIIFMDIGLPGINGPELADILPREQQFILIAGPGTALLNNFPYEIIDLLHLPFSYIDFAGAIEKTAAGTEQPLTTIPSGIDHLFFKSGSQMVRIYFNDILYIKGEREYISLHFKDQRLLIYRRMKEMENLLPATFIRVHLSYIINVNYVLKVVANKHLFIGETKIPIGGSYRTRIKHYIDLRAF